MESTKYHRNKKVSMQCMDGDYFLANEISGSIYHLNNIGAALWRILEVPHDIETIENLFISAFPDQSPKELTHDIKFLVKQLEEHQLITGKVD